jgi:Cft2 family RNA processing exonuclease
MRISCGRGIRVSSGSDIFIDASGLKGSNILISHSHSDHARITKSNSYFLTRESAALLSVEEKPNVTLLPYRKRFSLSGFDVSLHNAGHICGSSQFLLRNSGSVAVTSDFKLQKSLLTEPAEILSSEILVMETTYGKPGCRFMEREEAYREMHSWAKDAISAGGFVVLGGYSTGKAQELTKFCNEYLGVAPLLHSTAYARNAALSRCGVNLGDYIALNHNLNESDILIMPPHLINDGLISALSHQLKRKVSVAQATGQHFSKYKRFELSDHADFSQLMRYVEHSAPKMVFTHHGHAEHFARQVKRKFGIPARPLTASQKSLIEFGS